MPIFPWPSPVHQGPGLACVFPEFRHILQLQSTRPCPVVCDYRKLTIICYPSGQCNGQMHPNYPECVQVYPSQISKLVINFFRVHPNRPVCPPYMSQHVNSTGCRDAEQYTQAEMVKGLLILRVNGPVCFANVEHIKECMAQHEVCPCYDVPPLTNPAKLSPLRRLSC